MSDISAMFDRVRDLEAEVRDLMMRIAGLEGERDSLRDQIAQSTPAVHPAPAAPHA